MAVAGVSRRRVDARHGELMRGIGREIRAAREDAGLTQSELARRSGVDQGAISRLEAAIALPSPRALLAVAEALGARFSVRLFPGTGPRVRDAIQAAIVESLLTLPIHPRWRPNLEVPVYHPVRGVIDLTLTDRLEPLVIAVEVHSQIRRVEQQLRWAAEKADALPSARLWAETEPGARISRLLVLRSTRATREVARRYAATFAAAYPAMTMAARRALVSGEPWPGDALLWADVVNGRAAILDRPPRGIAVGR